MKRKISQCACLCCSFFACYAGGVVAVVVHGRQALMPLTSCGRAGPAGKLQGAEGSAFNSAAGLVYRPATGGVSLLDTPCFFNMFWNTWCAIVRSRCWDSVGMRARGMGVFPAAVSRVAGAVHAVHRSDAR